MIWFTSDHHFYHTNVIRYCKRPYATVEDMNQDMVRRWNETVAPSDVVYYLGDFAMAHRAVQIFLPQLNGTKRLIAGNHDHCHPVHFRSKVEKGERMRQLYTEAGFASIQLEKDIIIKSMDGHKQFRALMHHMPYANVAGSDHTPTERYSAWRPKDTGDWLLCGHIHEKWAQRGRMINVGVDVRDFRPISLDEIYKIMLNGPRDL